MAAGIQEVSLLPPSFFKTLPQFLDRAAPREQILLFIFSLN